MKDKMLFNRKHKPYFGVIVIVNQCILVEPDGFLKVSLVCGLLC